jgi:hypothetical protein
MHKVLLDYKLFINWCLGTATINNNKIHSNLLEEGGGAAKATQQQWLHMEHYYGLDQVSKGYSRCLKGELGPDTALIMSLWNDKELSTVVASPPNSKL